MNRLFCIGLAVVLIGCGSTDTVVSADMSNDPQQLNNPDAEFQEEVRENVCAYGQTRVHLVSPQLDAEWVMAVTAAAKTWGDILGPQHPQAVIVSDAASTKAIPCTTSWLPWSAGKYWGYTRAGYVLVNSNPMGLPTPSAILKQAITTHEMGHLLGLPHNPVFGSVMFSYITIGVGPDAHDINILCSLNGC